MKLNKLALTLCLLASTAMAQAQSCEEGFEGWDGVTTDWIPEGWTEIHTDNVIPTLNDGNCTWHVIDPTKSSTLPTAKEGKYYVAIGYARDAEGHDLEQDEWLLSPTYQLSEYGGTLNFEPAYSPLFLYHTEDKYIDWDSQDYIEREATADLEVWVRILYEGGEWGEWLPQSSLCVEWSTQPFSTLLKYFSSTAFHQHDTIFLTDELYQNQVVQIGFRYVGSYGNIIGIDKFRMGYATRYVEGINTLQGKPGTPRHTYDLQGRNIDANTLRHGLILQDGKKILR